jgi:hypothetical protein
MKLTTIFYTAIMATSFATVQAQTTVPVEYVKGSITLADGSIKNGFVKENIKKSAAIVFIDSTGLSKKKYEGSQINSVSIEATNFICINGDFFKIICSGKLCFLQKASNASGNTSYNGTEPIFISGTEEKIGDYFAYADKKLKLLNKKTVSAFINNDLSACMAAVEKAKSIDGDIAKLQEAVDIFNLNLK